jgi:hypothetical protein
MAQRDQHWGRLDGRPQSAPHRGPRNTRRKSEAGNLRAGRN